MFRATIFLVAIIVLCTGGPAISSGNKGWRSTPRHKNNGIFEPWECSFERDHVPPVTPEADKIFQMARAMQRDTPNPTEADKVRFFQMYKQAADMGHWKAMHNLANCYLNEWGTEFSVTTPDEIYEAMMARGIPSGYLGKALLTRRGWAVEQNREEAGRLHWPWNIITAAQLWGMISAR